MLKEKELEEIGKIELKLTQQRNEDYLRRCFVENLNETKILELVFSDHESNLMFTEIESECGYASKE